MAYLPIVSGGLVAGRRILPCPLLVASHGLKTRTRYQERSPFSPVTFVPDDEGKYTKRSAKHRVISTMQKLVIHRRAQIFMHKRK
jgi:hypothetical protein